MFLTNILMPLPNGGSYPHEPPFFYAFENSLVSIGKTISDSQLIDQFILINNALLILTNRL